MRENVQYLAAGKRSLSRATNLSLSVDASRVGKRKLLMGVLASSNPALASIVPPQAITPYQKMRPHPERNEDPQGWKLNSDLNSYCDSYWDSYGYSYGDSYGYSHLDSHMSNSYEF
eukprot:3591652-Amphidinium_carterae.1